MSESTRREVPRLGSPRLHLRLTGSTNDRARELASGEAPHGMLVTAAEQSAGRGRQGRTWRAPPGRALLCSLVLRAPPRLLPLIGGVAVAELATQLTGAQAQLKWPNDVLLRGHKVAGILVEGRPQERWAVLGLGTLAFGTVIAGPARVEGLDQVAVHRGFEPLVQRPLGVGQGERGQGRQLAGPGERG